MKTMEWTKMLKPTRWKVIVSLVPFIFPLFQVWLFFQIRFNLFVDVDNIMFDVEEIVDTVIFTSELVVANPFEPVLRSLGWWSNNSLVVFPDGPLLSGSIVIAITYSILLYIALSFLSAAWKKRRGNSL